MNEIILSFIKDTIKNFLILFVISVVLSTISAQIFNFIERSYSLVPHQTKNITYATVLIAPLIETYLLMKIIDIYDTKRSLNQKCIIIGLFWGLIHAITYVPSFLSASWAFFWFSKIFIKSSKAFGKRYAFIQSFIMHTLQNLIAYVLLNISIIFE